MNTSEVTFAFDVPTFAGAPVEGTEPDRSTTRGMSGAYRIRWKILLFPVFVSNTHATSVQSNT